MGLDAESVFSTVNIFVCWFFMIYVWYLQPILKYFIEKLLGFIFFSSCLYHVVFEESSITQETLFSKNWFLDTYEITVFGTFLLFWILIACFQRACSCSFTFFIRAGYFLFCLIQFGISLVSEEPLTNHAINGYNIGGMLVSLIWMFPAKRKVKVQNI